MAEVDFEKVKSIIVNKVNCKPEKVTKEVSFEELGFDSLDAVETIMAFEEEFDIEIPDEEADKMKTVGDAINCIAEKLTQKSS